jgi:hypothetical protein
MIMVMKSKPDCGPKNRGLKRNEILSFTAPMGRYSHLIHVSKSVIPSPAEFGNFDNLGNLVGAFLPPA